MGSAAEQRAPPGGETWLYYPSQPYGRKVLVARLAPDGKLIDVEQRLSEEYIARLIPNQSRKEDVRDLFGPPYGALFFRRQQRDTWSWHMRQFANLPAGLHVPRCRPTAWCARSTRSISRKAAARSANADEAAARFFEPRCFRRLSGRK